jgi:hypothetical protein
MGLAGPAHAAVQCVGTVWLVGPGRDSDGRGNAFGRFRPCCARRACASGGAAVQLAAESEYVLNISPDVARRAFAVELISRSSRPLCISYAGWPRGGQVSHPTRMTVDGRIYESDYENFGYCIGASCPRRIAPGGRLEAFISFSEFPGWDPGLDMSRAQVDFSVRPWRCRG